MAITLSDIYIKGSTDWNAYLDLIYPIGSIYITTSSTSPASSIGGSWAQMEPGNFLMTAGETYNVLSSGGSTSVTHDHTAEGYLTACISPNAHASGYTYYKLQGTSYTPRWRIGTSGSLVSASGSMTEGVYINGNVSSYSIPILPKYIAVNIYYRTS